MRNKSTMTTHHIEARLTGFANRDKAKLLQGFFKTGPGEYGEGDVFLGVMVPNIRKVAKEFSGASLSEILPLLHSPYHEIRLLALLMFVQAYGKGDISLKKKIYEIYLKNTRYINNWDLVDLSAPNIVGAWLVDKSRTPLHTLVRSRDLWKRRISILATFYFIKQNDFDDSLLLAEQLLDDQQDLLHKAVGWMLREVGKRDLAVEERFLKQHYKHMPRTMLRYAIERFPEPKRLKYLQGKM